jgi:hypothetical protein
MTLEFPGSTELAYGTKVLGRKKRKAESEIVTLRLA